MPDDSREPQPTPKPEEKQYCTCKAWGHSHTAGQCPRIQQTDDKLCFVCSILINT